MNTEIEQSASPVAIRAESHLDHLWSADNRRTIMKDGKMYINPFGVVLGRNLSGQSRGDETLTDKPFMTTTARFGVIQPVIVRKVDHQGVKAYTVVAGNRRTFALRHLIGTGVIPADSPRALLPIYEMNEIELSGVSPEDAANLLENGMRMGLDPIAKAQAIDNLVTGGASKEELALLVTGPNRRPLTGESIRQYRKLLKLHPSVQDALRKNIMIVSVANRIADMPHDEQLKTLQRITDAQSTGKNKHAVAAEIVKRVKKEKRQGDDGEPIFDAPRGAADIRRIVKQLGKVEAWDCIPKTAKISKEGYQALAATFVDFAAWLEGGLTPKKYKPEDVALTLQTRILATMAQLASRRSVQ